MRLLVPRFVCATQDFVLPLLARPHGVVDRPMFSRVHCKALCKAHAQAAAGGGVGGRVFLSVCPLPAYDPVDVLDAWTVAGLPHARTRQ